MGNCLVLQENVIKVMKPDGKILEYQAPIKAWQVLSDFSSHAIAADSHQALQQQFLLPDTNLLGGDRLYYLVPLQLPTQEIKKKKVVRFSVPDEKEKNNHDVEGRSTTSVVRIKLVISKQELQEMLRKGGVSVDDTVAQIKGQQRVLKKADAYSDSDHNDNYNPRGWKPVLESISEISH